MHTDKPPSSARPTSHCHVFFGEGAVALAEFLAESRQIQQLDLRQNEVKVGGLMALCLALRINRSLAGLHLDHAPPQEQVGPDIIHHLRVLGRFFSLPCSQTASAL